MHAHVSSNMICIECGHHVTSLYQQYSSSNIRLTACPRCGKFADKYIEHDDVLIFIDLILIKPQVYRHLAFNRLTCENGVLHSVVRKTFVLVTLFDVYLTWAQLEKNAFTGTSTDPLATVVLLWPPFAQYVFFLIYCLAQTLTTHVVLRLLASIFLSQKQQQQQRINSVETTNTTVHFKDISNGDGNGVTDEPLPSANVLSTALLISAATKLFPIIMVVWSYDIPAATKAVGWAVNVNTVEALNIVLRCGYPRAILMTVLAAIARTFIARGIILRITLAFFGSGMPTSGSSLSPFVSLPFLSSSSSSSWLS